MPPRPREQGGEDLILMAIDTEDVQVLNYLKILEEPASPFYNVMQEDLSMDKEGKFLNDHAFGPFALEMYTKHGRAREANSAYYNPSAKKNQSDKPNKKHKQRKLLNHDRGMMTMLVESEDASLIYFRWEFWPRIFAH